MENIIQPAQQNDNEHLQAYYILFVLLICVVCAKEPEYVCDNCNKVYRHEGWYNAHVLKCGGGGSINHKDEISPSISDFSELLRQNREMMVLLQKQQETIQVLVAQLMPVIK
jgi:hypothetical protein